MPFDFSKEKSMNKELNKYIVCSVLFSLLFISGCNNMEKKNVETKSCTSIADNATNSHMSTSTCSAVEENNEVKNWGNIYVPDISKAALPGKTDREIVAMCMDEIILHVNEYKKLYKDNVKGKDIQDEVDLMSEDGMAKMKALILHKPISEFENYMNLEYMMEFLSTEAYNIDVDDLHVERMIDIEKEEENGESRIDNNLIPIEILFSSKGNDYCAYFSVQDGKLVLQDIMNETYVNGLN